MTLGAVAAVLLAPALGGLIIDRVGWRAVFALTSAMGVVLLVPIHLVLSETIPAGRARPTVPGTLGSRFGRLLRSRVFLGYSVQSALHFAIFFSFTSASTYLMVDVLERPAYEYGAWFVFMALFVAAGLAVAERAAGRVPTGRLACVGSAVVMSGTLVSGVLLLSSAVALSPATLFVPASIAAFGVGLALPGTNAGVMEVDARLAGTASGLLSFMQFAVAAIFVQLVVMDEPNTARVLGVLLMGGGGGAFVFGLLSAGHGFVKTRST